MKKNVSYRLLPCLPLICGCIALMLRQALYTMLNQSGLLPYRHPLYLATLILAAATAILVGCFVFRLKGERDYETNFPRSKAAALGSVLAGICLVFTVLSIRKTLAMVMPLDNIWMILGLAAAISLISAGYFLWAGKRVPFLQSFVVCLYFALHMICRYREWSGNPQTEDYIFAIFACICLAMFSYQRTAFCTGLGQRRMLLFFGLMALFFCPSMLLGSNDTLFYLAGTIWAATNLCTIDPPQTKSKEE